MTTGSTGEGRRQTTKKLILLLGMVGVVVWVVLLVRLLLPDLY